MTAANRLPHPVELIRLHRVSPTFAFADARIPGVHLRSIAVAQQPSGALRITPPNVAGRDGRLWPCFALQPGTREAVEQAIREAWDASTASPRGAA
jgi:hypothetical protein